MDTDVNAPGGVMTDEVGVITGELTLRTTVDGGQVTVQVQYKDADEWYHVIDVAVPAGAEAVHKVIVNLLHRPE